MKRLLFVLLSVLLLVISALFFRTCDLFSDDYLGKAMSSDILATVDGTPIRSFNVDGKTAIALDDLRDYTLVKSGDTVEIG